MVALPRVCVGPTSTGQVDSASRLGRRGIALDCLSAAAVTCDTVAV